MTSWLRSQRKQTLLDLSEEAGLEQDADLRKDDILEALDTHLQQNAASLASNATFDPYYGVRRTPFKARQSTAVSDEVEVKSVVKGRGKRATKVKQEEADDHAVASSPAGPSSFSTPKPLGPTPVSAAKRPIGRARRPEQQLPPSPADVADLAEFESSQIYAGLNDAYSVSGIPEAIEYLRDICSSVTGVQMTVQLLEAFALQRAVLPWVYLTQITGVRGSGAPMITLYYPDLFKLLTPEFWLPTLLYSTTSIFIPSLFAYFFNLTIRDVKRHGAVVSVARYTVDPLTFQVVKALLTWLVYVQAFGGYIVGEAAVDVVDHAMFGGAQGMLVGCGVCILASLYEAAQRKP